MTSLTLYAKLETLPPELKSEASDFFINKIIIQFGFRASFSNLNYYLTNQIS